MLEHCFFPPLLGYYTVFILANISDQISLVDSAFQCLIKFQRPQCYMATLQNFHAPFKSLNVLRFSFFLSCCSDKNCKASKHLCFWVALIHQPERYVEATSKDTFMWVGQSNNVTTFIPGPKMLSFLHEKIVLWISQGNYEYAQISSPLYIKSIV